MRINSEPRRFALVVSAWVALCLLGLPGCDLSQQAAKPVPTPDSVAVRPAPCSADWNRRVEALLSSGDGHGHGPDIGSDEWQSVMEFKLGLRGDARLPERGSAAWCALIDQQVPWPSP